LIPTTLAEWLLCLAIFLVGCGLFAIGNRLLGRQSEGGKRLVVFAGGIALCVLGLYLCRLALPAFRADDYPAAIVFFLGAASASGAIWLLWASFFASGKTLEGAFELLTRVF
jgi:hypothetical protein